MTDPVDTDALRGLAAWLHAQSAKGNSRLVTAAADELDRIRGKLQLASDHREHWEQRALNAESVIAAVRPYRFDIPIDDEPGRAAYSALCFWPSRLRGSKRPSGSE